MKKEKRTFSVKKIDEEYDNLFSALSALSLPQGCLDLTTYVVSELFANVKEHSQAKKTVIDFAVSASSFYFFVSDNGIGMRNSFLKSGIFAKDERAAIQLAIGGISTKKKNERAFGLFSVLRLVEYTRGIMSIHTGKSKAVFEKNKTVFENVKKIKGTEVVVHMPLKKINLYEVIY